MIAAQFQPSGDPLFRPPSPTPSAVFPHPSSVPMTVKTEEEQMLNGVTPGDDDDMDQLDPEEEEEEGETLEPEYVLPPSKMVQISVRDLFKGVQNGEINTSPDYQREAVWNPTNQQNIIDSIINDFYIPPLLFASRVESDPEEPDVEYSVMNVVDGKQRLTSITKFMSGTIPYVHRSTNRKYWWTSPAGSKRPLLPASWKKHFESKAMYCVQWEQLNDELEREIFKRVQYGMQLSPAEKMHAIASPWANLVRMISKQYIADGISQEIKWTRTRGQDFQFVAQILFLIWRRGGKSSFPSAPVLDAFLRSELPPSKDFIQSSVALFADYLTMTQHGETSYGFHGIADRLAPVEVVMIGYLLWCLRGAPKAVKAKEIDGLRRTTRTEFVDVRANTRVTTFMFEYVRKAIERADGPGGGLKNTPSKKRGREDAEEWRPGAGMA